MFMAVGDPTGDNEPRFDLPEHLVNALIFETFGDQRYTQDSPIMPEVWVAYARAPRKPLDILLTPRSGDSPSQLASRLAHRLKDFEGAASDDAIWAEHNIAYSRSSVVVRATFRQLACVIVPMTAWWSALGQDARDYFALRDNIERLAKDNMSVGDIIIDASRVMKRSAWDFIRFGTLAGFVALAGEYESRVEEAERAQKDAPKAQPTRSRKKSAVSDAAGEADPARIRKNLEDKLREFIKDLSDKDSPIGKVTELIDAYERIANCVTEDTSIPPLKIFMITENREAHLSIAESRATVKADAANNVFHIDTGGLAWAVIDGGIDARHPAFLDRKETDKRLQQDKQDVAEENKGQLRENREPADEDADSSQEDRGGDLATEADRKAQPTRIDDDVWSKDIPLELLTKLSRVSETYDFTYLRRMLATKKLPPPEEGGPSEEIAKYIREKHKTELDDLGIRTGKGREIDWDIVAPLIRVPHDEHYVPPAIGHGTHVAGIIGSDWFAKDNPEAIDLIGICPQIRLYDLRVFKPDSGSDEFTVQYALQFVEHLNRNRELPRVHGVNLSLSMLHKVMSFACGRTPVCDECNDLVSTGVVVVVAAGNDGYKTFKTDKGDYSGYHAASITDPGNAEGVITVGSTHRSHPHNYGVSYFSSRGPTGDGRRKPDLVAPGEKITAPVVNCGAQRMDGTSMAAPHVSGAAALLMARHRELIGEPRRIKEILCLTATDLGREPHFQGAGMVDILRALQSV
jgi:serine protease AprX